jgi:DNA-binding MltR family transcriptional regulator
MTTFRSNLDEYKWESFFEEFQSESPRAAVILSAAFLDSLLRDLLVSFMIDDPTAINEFLGSDKRPEAPIGSFGARIAAAYSLGFLSKVEYDDLRCIKKIRNKFAHKIHGYSFDNGEIVTLCNKLQTPTEDYEVFPPHLDTPQQRYVFTVSYLLMQISLRILEAGKEQRIVRGKTTIVQVVKLD